MSKPYLVIKIGGKPAANLVRLFGLLEEILSVQKDYSPILIHGGGAEVTELGKKLGLEANFVNGIRMTTPDEMDVVDMVLGGLMNTRVLRQGRKAGLRVVGISGVDGGLWTAESIGPDPKGTPNRTGRILQQDPSLIYSLCALGFVPIMSSIATDAQGLGLNINADDGALALAESLKAKYLVFISDIPGVLKDKQVIPILTPRSIEEEIAQGIIQGGMIPKVRAAASALEQGVGAVSIGNFEKVGDLAALIQGTRGTLVRPSAD
ncbi:MAG: acetylglutamate kinase [Spirochaetales bacterium]|nr:acetylglutamate kinase [Spirochaetales bacterium]